MRDADSGFPRLVLFGYVRYDDMVGMNEVLSSCIVKKECFGGWVVPLYVELNTVFHTREVQAIPDSGDDGN